MPAPNKIPNHQRTVVLALMGLFVLGILLVFLVMILRFMSVGQGMH
jgi:hypothetical protein